MKSPCIPIAVTPEITLYHRGPPLEDGPLPSFFYFSLSGPDSLTLDPYNQPVQHFLGQKIRVFSMTLPAHEEGLLATNAMTVWAENFSEGSDFLERFFSEVEKGIEFAIQKQLIDPHHMAVGGLSRGAFVAAHMAARVEKFQTLLGFAPLTQLGAIKEFKELQDHQMVRKYDLTHLASKLENRRIRLYIGNCDKRVSTRSCFDFAMSISEPKQTRAAELELFINKSIGQSGHGTAPEIFKQGVEWIVKHI